MREDTIAAISTPHGRGGISVIRISGSEALPVAERVFKAGRRLSELAGYEACFGHVFDGERRLDECVATVFRAPHSYTGEDTVELSCHGGIYVTRAVLEAVLRAGALPALPGEFTERAFLNGKLDLAEAEAVSDLINAGSERALDIAERNRSGAVSRKINELCDRILSLLAKIAVFCDYPEDESLGIDEGEFLSETAAVADELRVLIKNYENGRLIKDGIDTVIAGRPNVGKSTLMNFLSGCERSIVTEIPGTTRDIVETDVSFFGITLRLADTAGLRDTDDPVESIGVKRAIERMANADLCLMLFDAGRTPSEEELDLLEKYNAKTVAVINKTDLNRADTAPFADRGVVFCEISAKNKEGAEQLASAIKERLKLIEPSAGDVIMGGIRQKNCAERALSSLEEADASLRSCAPYDAVGVILDDAYAALAELTGARVSTEVADRVFRDFCVGK